MSVVQRIFKLLVSRWKVAKHTMKDGVRFWIWSCGRWASFFLTQREKPWLSRFTQKKQSADRYTSHVTFSPAQRTCSMMCDTPHWLKCLHERFTSSAWYPRCAVVSSLTLCSSPCSFPCVSPIFYLNPDLNLFLHVDNAEANITCARSLAPWQNSLLSQVMSPSSLTTSTTRRLPKSSSRSNPATTRCPRTCLTRNSTMRSSAERSLHHFSFRSEKNQQTWDKLITLMKKVCCQLSPFLCVTQVRGDPYMNKVRTKNENQVAKWKTRESGFSLKDKKSKFLLILEPRFRNINFKPILIEEVSRNLLELLILSEGKLIIQLQVMNNPGEINNFFVNNCQNKFGIFVKLVSKVFMRWKNWREFKSNESMNFRKEDWSKIRTLLMNSRQEFRNYRMKSIVWMTREILRMLSQYEVDYPTFPVNRRYSHLIVILVDC